MKSSKEICDDRSSYLYDALDPSFSQIRLVGLAPATLGNAPVYCVLKTVSLFSRECEYEAVSYTWGAKANQFNITINERTIRVSKNLFVALRGLRQATSTRVLWVDAICIDQTNLEEKSQQICQMRNVYDNVSAVLVFLGDLDKDVEQAMGFSPTTRRNPEETCQTSDWSY